VLDAVVFVPLKFASFPNLSSVKLAVPKANFIAIVRRVDDAEMEEIEAAPSAFHANTTYSEEGGSNRMMMDGIEPIGGSAPGRFVQRLTCIHISCHDEGVLDAWSSTAIQQENGGRGRGGRQEPHHAKWHTLALHRISLLQLDNTTRDLCSKTNHLELIHKRGHSSIFIGSLCDLVGVIANVFPSLQSLCLRSDSPGRHRCTYI